MAALVNDFYGQQFHDQYDFYAKGHLSCIEYLWVHSIAKSWLILPLSLLMRRALCNGGQRTGNLLTE
jgi:hypothetical protein